MLNQEQQEYYDDLDEMFSTKGWKLLVEEAKAQVYQNQSSALECKDWTEVSILRGKTLALVDIINLEMVSDAQRASLEEDDYDADL